MMDTAKTVPALVANLNAQLKAVQGKIASIKDRATARRLEAFTANGGCKRCRGRGWVVVWDTMDSMSGCYAEYGECSEPGCTPGTRATSGLHPVVDKYDCIRGTNVVLEFTSAESRTLTTLNKWADELTTQLRSSALRLDVAKNDEVVVVRGRDKAARGKVGRVFYSRPGQWGVRVGLNTADGQTVWTYARNVDRLVTE